MTKILKLASTISFAILVASCSEAVDDKNIHFNNSENFMKKFEYSYDKTLERLVKQGNRRFFILPDGGGRKTDVVSSFSILGLPRDKGEFEIKGQKLTIKPNAKYTSFGFSSDYVSGFSVLEFMETGYIGAGLNLLRSSDSLTTSPEDKNSYEKLNIKDTKINAMVPSEDVANGKYIGEFAVIVPRFYSSQTGIKEFDCTIQTGISQASIDYPVFESSKGSTKPFIQKGDVLRYKIFIDLGNGIWSKSTPDSDGKPWDFNNDGNVWDKIESGGTEAFACFNHDDFLERNNLHRFCTNGLSLGNGNYFKINPRADLAQTSDDLSKFNNTEISIAKELVIYSGRPLSEIWYSKTFLENNLPNFEIPIEQETGTCSLVK